MSEPKKDNTVTAEELQALSEEMSTRVKEFIVVHARDEILNVLDENKNVFTDDVPTENLVVRYDMVFTTADLRMILEEHRAGRVKPMAMPSKEPLYE